MFLRFSDQRAAVAVKALQAVSICNSVKLYKARLDNGAYLGQFPGIKFEEKHISHVSSSLTLLQVVSSTV